MVQWLNYLLLSSPSNYHELGTMVIIKRSWKQSHPGWMLPRVLPGPALPRTETLDLEAGIERSAEPPSGILFPGSALVSRTQECVDCRVKGQQEDKPKHIHPDKQN